MSKKGSVGSIASLLALTLISSEAFGWDIHRTLMPFILEGAPASLKSSLQKNHLAPCEPEDKAVLQTLIHDLRLNPASTLPPTVSQGCQKGMEVSGETLLLGPPVDDPDQGLDRDLPPELAAVVDPKGDRKWMGGTQGPASQGFRHMFFGGWKILKPITTFQIPIRAMGHAPQRAEAMASKARELMQSGKTAWGIRVSGWALHYIQDLAQPFHSVQQVSLKMLPWYELFSWPLGDAFSRFVKETTRVITNYHWAYEGYVRTLLLKGPQSPFKDCLVHPENYALLSEENLKTKNPYEVARAVADASIQLAPDLGAAEMDFIGVYLRLPESDLTQNRGTPDYENIAIRPDLNESRQRLHSVTCRALANAALASRRTLEWVFQSAPSSPTR